MDAKLIGERLKEPFPLSKLGFKPQTVTKDGKRALAVPYIDARDVMDRLDDVVGPDNWADSYEIVADGSVVCRLKVCFGDLWIAKSDVGSPSEQPDGGDRLKAAFSDALKRAAVKFGVGRYLYAMPNVWHDFDSTKKQFVGTPSVPASFLPAADKGQKGAPKPPPAAPPTAPEPQPADADRVVATDLFGFLDAIATAGSLPSLAHVWTQVNDAYRDKCLTKANVAELERAKEARKAVLTNPKAPA